MLKVERNANQAARNCLASSKGKPEPFLISRTRLSGIFPLLPASCSPLRLDVARCAFGQARRMLHDTSGKMPEA